MSLKDATNLHIDQHSYHLKTYKNSLSLFDLIGL